MRPAKLLVRGSALLCSAPKKGCPKHSAQLNRLHLTPPVPRYFLGALVKRAKLEGSD